MFKKIYLFIHVGTEHFTPFFLSTTLRLTHKLRSGNNVNVVIFVFFRTIRSEQGGFLIFNSKFEVSATIFFLATLIAQSFLFTLQRDPA